jgi:hypothetical protein
MGVDGQVGHMAQRRVERFVTDEVISESIRSGSDRVRGR